MDSGLTDAETSLPEALGVCQLSTNGGRVSYERSCSYLSQIGTTDREI